MNLFRMTAIAAAALTASCGGAPQSKAQDQAPSSAPAAMETAVYAGGCFWCIEADLEKLDGVGDVVSGYAGGDSQNPTYRNHADHIEVVRAPYDPAKISYRELTDYFLRHIDPLDSGGQFCDRGNSYTTAIFYNSAEQKAGAEAAIASAQTELDKNIVTPIRELDQFWVAEDYHQDYYKKNPIRYKYYRTSCGRDRRVNKVWGK